MKCPLRSFRGKGTYDQDQSEDLDCQKEECGCWDDKFQQCVEITNAEQLLRIANALNTLLEKMPKEFQFRK